MTHTVEAPEPELTRTVTLPDLDGLAIRRVAQALRRAGIRDKEALKRFIAYRPDLADEMLVLCGGSKPEVPTHRDMITRYEYDPVGFCRDVLREYVTPDCARFMQAVADGDWVAAQSANATGKSWSMGALAWWGLLCHEWAQVYLVAAGDELNMRRLLWSKVVARVERRPGLLTCLQASTRFKMTDLKIQRYHGGNPMEAYIEGLIIPQAANDDAKMAKTSGKHAPFLMFLVDEADAVPDPVFLGIETCLSGGRTKLVCSFNPRVRSGYVYERLNKQFKVVHLSALTHPNVMTGKDVVPGAVGHEITCRRIFTMCEYVKEDEGRTVPGCFKLPKWLENAPVRNEEHRKIGTLAPGWYRATVPHFAPMVLGKFSAIGDEKAIFNRQYLGFLSERLREQPHEQDRMAEGSGLRGELTIWHAPDSRDEYVITADPAEGLEGGDYSVADVWNLRSWEQVAQYRGKPDPGEFAGDLASLGAWYNGAMICVERNNHGHAVLLGLSQLQGYDNIYRHDDGGLGYPVSDKQRVYLIGQLQSEFNLGAKGDAKLRINSPITVEECLNYVKHDRGYGAAKGFHDDTVSTLRLAYEMLRREETPWTTEFKQPEPTLLYGAGRRGQHGGR